MIKQLAKKFLALCQITCYFKWVNVESGKYEENQVKFQLMLLNTHLNIMLKYKEML